MKNFLSGLLCGMVVFAAYASDGERAYPTWFVVEQAGSAAVAEVTESQENAESPKEAVLIEENIDIRPRRERLARARLARKEMALEENRFAKNNKDLLLAEKLVKLIYQKNPINNFVVSPLSFYAVSVLIANGVVDETLFEFSSIFPVLHLTEADKIFKAYISSKDESVSLYSALWSGVFSEHYKIMMQEYLDAELWGIGNTTQIINDWVSSRSQGVLGAFAEAEKANSGDIYASGGALFKINKVPFRVQSTNVQQFFNLDETVSNIKFLKGEAVADYFENADMQVLRLVYPTGDRLTLWLPNSDVDFEAFIDEIDLNFLKPRFERKDVKILLPEIDIEYAIKNVSAVYEAMGIKRIFEKGNYDFAKMISFDNPVKIKQVFFNSRVMLKENLSDETTEELSAKVSFEADHPFVFMINDGDFIGVYVSGKK